MHEVFQRGGFLNGIVADQFRQFPGVPLQEGGAVDHYEAGGGDQGEGVVVLADLGSAVISSQAAISMLDEPLRSRVRIADAPVLEGAIGAGVEAASDDVSSLDLVVSTAEGSRQLHKK